MTDVPFIYFYPYIDSPNPEIEKSKYEKDPKGKHIDIMAYKAIFFLKNDNFISQGVVKRPEIVGKYTVWIDNNKETPGNVEIIFNERKDKPYSIEEAAVIADKLVKAKNEGKLVDKESKAKFLSDLGVSDYHL